MAFIFCTYKIVPESPRWLVTVGKMEEAKKVLVRIFSYCFSDISILVGKWGKIVPLCLEKGWGDCFGISDTTGCPDVYSSDMEESDVKSFSYAF